MISEILQGYARPLALKKSSSFIALAQIYKQLDASFGSFTMDTLKASTRALASNDAGDTTYITIEGQIDNLTSQLNGAEFNSHTFSDAQAQQLIAQAHALAISP